MPINSRNESITEWNCNEKLANRKLEKTEKIRLDFSFFSASSPVFRQFEGHWNEFATSFYLSCNRITRERGRKKTDRCSSNFLSFFLSFFSLFPLFPQFTSQLAFFLCMCSSRPVPSFSHSPFLLLLRLLLLASPRMKFRERNDAQRPRSNYSAVQQQIEYLSS